MFLVGYAYQLGAIPLSAAAIEQAIALNGEAVAMNTAAFHWGRRAAVDRAEVERWPAGRRRRRAMRERLSESLTRWWSGGKNFSPTIRMPLMRPLSRRLVETLKAAEAARTPGKTGLAEAVARYLFKLMAYKDEYEVARLYTDGAFQQAGRQRRSTATIFASNSISRRPYWHAATRPRGFRAR